MQETSDFIRRIRDIFDGFHTLRDHYMLAFLGHTGEATCFGVGPYEKPWDIHDECRKRQPEKAHRLVLAFDLHQPFDSQMPRHFRQAASWEPFKRHPLIHLPGRPLHFRMNGGRGAHLSLVGPS